jgi:hypothetical protein
MQPLLIQAAVDLTPPWLQTMWAQPPQLEFAYSLILRKIVSLSAHILVPGIAHLLVAAAAIVDTRPSPARFKGVLESARTHTIFQQFIAPMHKDDPKDSLRTLQPMGQMSDVKDIMDAIIYLTQASQVTVEVLHLDGGAHVVRW